MPFSSPDLAPNDFFMFIAVKNYVVNEKCLKIEKLQFVHGI